MSIPSPFHPRTLALCRSMRWKDWAGYYAVCYYDTCHEREYFAIRESAGLLDISPLFKYDVEGPDAQNFLAFVMTRDISKLKIGRVAYCSWTDHLGKLLDDGTVTRLDLTRYRVTAAEPTLHWFLRLSRGFNVSITDVSKSIAALALQGPTSRDILKNVCDADLDKLKFFRATLPGQTAIDGCPVVLTRTGYTGDLGYEIWLDAEHALKVWDAIMAAGLDYGIEPLGLDALDVARVEAGFILNGVDYRSARTCMTLQQTSSPFEAGLGWTVHLDREPFVGQEALTAEHARGPEWALVGLEIDWPEIEALYDRYGLPPHLSSNAWRAMVPLFAGPSQIGYATSGVWSPLLKKNLALATVPTRYSALGTELKIEFLVEHWRHHVTATVVEKPFFNPPRKRS